MNVTPAQSDRSRCLAELRRRVGMIERGRFGTATGTDMPTMVERTVSDPASLTPFLAGGAEPALHELVADGYGSQPSARDFSLALAASLLHHRQENQGQWKNRGRPDDRGMVLWCQRRRDTLEFGPPYGPGLRSLGLPPDRLLMVTGKRDADCLWAMEQGLASRSLLAVVGVVDRVDLTASRRLSLAARAHGSWCLLLPLQHGREPSAARTRWRIKAAPSIPDVLDPKGLGLPSWQLVLERSPNGSTGHWTVEWDHATHHFHLVTAATAARRGGPAAGCDSPDKQNSDVIAFNRTG